MCALMSDLKDVFERHGAEFAGEPSIEGGYQFFNLKANKVTPTAQIHFGQHRGSKRLIININHIITTTGIQLKTKKSKK